MPLLGLAMGRRTLHYKKKVMLCRPGYQFWLGQRYKYTPKATPKGLRDLNLRCFPISKEKKSLLLGFFKAP